MREHRRPAGVDPTVIEPPASLDPEARAIGRRVAAKVLASRALAAPEHELHGLDGLDLDGDDLAEIVEAEIRSTRGTPREGVVDLSLDYTEALTLAVAVVDAQGSERSATERGILAELRIKLFEALGLA